MMLIWSAAFLDLDAGILMIGIQVLGRVVNMRRMRINNAIPTPLPGKTLRKTRMESRRNKTKLHCDANVHVYGRISL